MIKEFKHLDKLAPHIDTAFKKFYDKMLTDMTLSSFFDSKEQIDALIVKQQEFFTKSIYMNEKQMEQVYIKIGEYHHKINIPYIDFMKGMDILEESFLLYSQKEVKSLELMEEIFIYFRFIKARTAKGYLNMMLEDDLKDIDMFFDNLDNIEYKNNREIVFDRISWLKDLIISLQSDDIQESDLLEKENKFNDWLTQIEFSDEKQKAFIKDLERRILQNTKNLFFFLNRGDFLEILPLYSSLLNIYKLSLLLSNSVSITTSDHLISKLHHDKLTNLYRKDYYLPFLGKELSYLQRNNECFSLLSIDVDDFKHINDNYGHLNGDKVLEKIGEIINNRIRSSDVGFRNGGDEFGVILKGANEEQSYSIAQKIKNDLLSYKFHDEDKGYFHVDISIGILECNEKNKNDDLDEIQKKLDKNLYKSKEDGKGRISK